MQSLGVYAMRKTARSDSLRLPPSEGRTALPLPRVGTAMKIERHETSFLSSIHEFRSHGVSGRSGWTFVADPDWSITDGFRNSSDNNEPKWRQNPTKVKIFEAVRTILKPVAPKRIQVTQLLPMVKEKVDFARVKDERQYLVSVLREAPCFDFRKISGWGYVPDLDQWTETPNVAESHNGPWRDAS
jgi:hypothetical protein